MNKAIQSPTGRNQNKIEDNETSTNGEMPHNGMPITNPRTRIILTIFSVVAYILLFTSIYYSYGQAMAVSATIPVFVVGWLYGLVPGICAGVLSFPANIFMYELFGVKWLEGMLLSGGGILGTFVLILIGAILGRIRDLSMQLKKKLYDHIRVEEALQESEKMMSVTLRSIGDAVIATGRNGSIILMNQIAEQLTGWREKEALGKDIKEVFYIVNEETGAEVESPVTKVLKEGVIAGLAKHTLLIAKDGTRISIDDSGAPIKNNEGKVIGVILVFRDVTEKRNAEVALQKSHDELEQRVKERTAELGKSNEQLKETRDYLDNLIESSLDCIMVSDGKGCITRVNKYFLELLNYSKEDVIGKHVMELTPMIEEGTFECTTGEVLKIGKEFADDAKRMISKLLEEGKITNWETCYFSKDKKVIPIEQNIAYLYNEKGEKTGAVAIIRDITERKKMEEKLIQSEKLKSLGELSGGVAHDFNNVLAAILGRVQLLKAHFKPTSGKQERRKSIVDLIKSLEIIERASIDGAETVRRIQEFSRKRVDDKDFTEININELLDNALEFTSMRWKNDAESKGIKITIQKEFSPLPSTLGSASELREVFTNLINNALDAMPQGGTIKITTISKGGQIAITVEDTGCGIPKSIKDKIFDPFFTTKGAQSTGLGMSVSYGIINRHGGSIGVDSVEGKGTNFTIKLPISENRLVEKEKTKPLLKECRKSTILVIEDEDEVRNLLADILIANGHEVETASDGIRGIEMFKKKGFDLVFTDLGMPGTSGWEVAETVKSINRRIPVAIITGWNIELKESEMSERGVNLIAYKPFKIDQILRLVQEGMELREQFEVA